MTAEEIINLIAQAHIPDEKKNEILTAIEQETLDDKMAEELQSIFANEAEIHKNEKEEAMKLKQKIIEERDKEIKIAKPKMQKVLERHKENMENIVKTVEKEGKELIAHLEKEIEGAIKKGDLNKIDDIKKKLGL